MSNKFKSHAYYFFNDIFNIKNINPNKIKIRILTKTFSLVTLDA